MHCANNVVIMQTEQLGRIEALEEELHSSRAKMVELEQKTAEQDQVIAQLVSDNLEHLQDNMRLTAHINSSQEQMGQLEHQLGQVGSVLMGMIEGAIEREGLMDMSSLLEAETLGASGDSPDDQGGDEDNVDTGASTEESMRRDSPILQEGGLIAEMEREAMEAGLGGWFNGNPEEVPESWSGSNSDMSASQDRVGMTLLTTIGSRTLPNPVRVPDNLIHPAVLTDLMEGPIWPWQCLVWSESSPPRYLRDLPLDHSSCLGGVLLQVGPSLIDIDGEYRGGGVVEEVEENKGGDVSIEWYSEVEKIIIQ